MSNLGVTGMALGDGVTGGMLAFGDGVTGRGNVGLFVFVIFLWLCFKKKKIKQMKSLTNLCETGAAFGDGVTGGMLTLGDGVTGIGLPQIH